MKIFLIPVLRYRLLILFAAMTFPAVCHGDEAIYTNHTRFNIPYEYDAAEMQRMQADEIQLYISTDQGASWVHSQSVEPQAAKFGFVAEYDAEYWFAVKTKNKQQQLIPPMSATQAEMKVAVDTTKPQFTLKLVQPESGRVNLSWYASDPNLDINTLEMEYRQPQSGGWQQVRVLPTEEGETAWSVPVGGVVAVRGLIKDRSGNIATTDDEIEITPGNGRGLPAADFSQPIASQKLLTRNVSLSQKPAQMVAQNPVVAPQPKATSVPNYNHVTPELLKTARMVNSLRFQLNYQVEQVGPSGVGKVEFFITENQGQQWFRYGEDTDRQSPYTIQVHQDGVYGFDLRVHSGAGLVSAPPQPGEKPPIVVIVDQTAPEITLEKPVQGYNGMLNQIMLKWKVSEAYPANQPISLEYGTSAIGPWLPIGTWQADQGHYLWELNENMPPELYFKVSARDMAGNIGSAQNEEPIRIDLSRPSARILNVEAVPFEAGDSTPGQ